MSQNATVMAFRKRLKQRGYTDISIIKIKGYESRLKPNTYVIKATEPLGKQRIQAEYTTEKMHISFK